LFTLLLNEPYAIPISAYVLAYVLELLAERPGRPELVMV
jgi:hypothetical protein